MADEERWIKVSPKALHIVRQLLSEATEALDELPPPSSSAATIKGIKFRVDTALQLTHLTLATPQSIAADQ